MMRFAMPFYDLQNKKSGIVLLNYFGSYLLDRFKEYSRLSPGSLLLTNRSGYYLVGETPEEEWGFMFPDQVSKEKTLAHDYPDTWTKIVGTERGQFEMEDGLFTYATAYPLGVGMKSSTGTGKAVGKSELLLGAGEYYWKIVSFVPKKILYAEHTKLKQILGFFMLGLSILITVASWKLSLSRYQQNQAEEELKQKTQNLFESNLKLEKLATTDALTGLANRRFAMMALERLWKESEQHHKPLACMMIDVGDRVLCQLANELKDTVRTDDIVCRLGGMNFLLFVPTQITKVC